MATIERRFPRFPIALHCLYSMESGAECAGTAVNLSRGGCAVRGSTPVQAGDYLRILLFVAPNQPPVEIGLAPVRWASGEHFGVEFISLTPRDAQRLQDYLHAMDND